jgi:hypothetical protein
MDASGATPSTEQVRALVMALLELQDFEGRDVLLAQAQQVEYVEGPLTMARLRVSGVCPSAHGVRSPVPNSASVVSASGEIIGMLLLWLDDAGYIDCLEYAWVTDEMPTHLPDPRMLDKWDPP